MPNFFGGLKTEMFHDEKFDSVNYFIDSLNVTSITTTKEF